MHGETCYCRGVFSLERWRKRRRGPVSWSCSLGRGWGCVGFSVPLGMSLGLGKNYTGEEAMRPCPVCPSPALPPGAVRGGAPSNVRGCGADAAPLPGWAWRGRAVPSGCQIPESPRVLCRRAGLRACCRLLTAVQELLVLAGTAGRFSRSRSSR